MITLNVAEFSELTIKWTAGQKLTVSCKILDPELRKVLYREHSSHILIGSRICLQDFMRWERFLVTVLAYSWVRPLSASHPDSLGFRSVEVPTW